MKPFLSWAGNKYSVIDQISALMPKGERFIDVFCGSGAVFMNVKFDKYLVADLNEDLIFLFHEVKRNPAAFMSIARNMFASFRGEDDYYRVRNDFNTKDSSGFNLIKAAQILYLNKHCYNGLFRRNLKGKLNSPYGHRSKVYFPEKEMMDFQSIAPLCDFFCWGYESTISQAGVGDVVYCDPPYAKKEGSEMFTQYAGAAWGMDEQKKLLNFCLDAHERGAKIVISNSDSSEMIGLYKRAGFEIHLIPTRRKIAASSASRVKVMDILAIKE